MHGCTRGGEIGGRRHDHCTGNSTDVLLLFLLHQRGNVSGGHTKRSSDHAINSQDTALLAYCRALTSDLRPFPYL